MPMTTARARTARASGTRTSRSREPLRPSGSAGVSWRAASLSAGWSGPVSPPATVIESLSGVIASASMLTLLVDRKRDRGDLGLELRSQSIELEIGVELCEQPIEDQHAGHNEHRAAHDLDAATGAPEAQQKLLQGSNRHGGEQEGD